MPVKVRRGKLSSRSFTELEVLRAGGKGVSIFGPFGPAAMPECGGTEGVSTAEPDCEGAVRIKETTAKIKIAAASVKRCIGEPPFRTVSACYDGDA